MAFTAPATVAGDGFGQYSGVADIPAVERHSNGGAASIGGRAAAKLRLSRSVGLTTTDRNGHVTFALPAPGSYDAIFTAQKRDGGDVEHDSRDDDRMRFERKHANIAIDSFRSM